MNVVESALIIGITGGSGSGKTTLARQLQKRLGHEACAVLSQDAYYHDQSALFDRDGGAVNFDHPEALEFSLLAKHLEQLRAGQDILVPQYDFATHRRVAIQPFPARRVVVVDGILILTQEQVRDCLDFSVFVDTREDLRFARRLERDTRERGRTPEGVHQQFFSQVKPMHDLFVEPCRDYAREVVSGEQSFDKVIDALLSFIERPEESWPQSKTDSKWL